MPPLIESTAGVAPVPSVAVDPTNVVLPAVPIVPVVVMVPDPALSDVPVIAPNVDSSISVPPIQLVHVKSEAVAAVPEILMLYVPELTTEEKSPAVRLEAVIP